MAQQELVDAMKMMEEQNSGLSQISSNDMNMIGGSNGGMNPAMYHNHSGSPKKNRPYGYYK